MKKNEYFICTEKYKASLGNDFAVVLSSASIMSRHQVRVVTDFPFELGCLYRVDFTKVTFEDLEKEGC